MKTKNLILFALISSFFLIFLVSIWKILATLQGLNIQNFNLQIIFIFGQDLKDLFNSYFVIFKSY